MKKVLLALAALSLAGGVAGVAQADPGVGPEGPASGCSLHVDGENSGFKKDDGQGGHEDCTEADAVAEIEALVP